MGDFFEKGGEDLSLLWGHFYSRLTLNTFPNPSKFLAWVPPFFYSQHCGIGYMNNLHRPGPLVLLNVPMPDWADRTGYYTWYPRRDMYNILPSSVRIIIIIIVVITEGLARNFFTSIFPVHEIWKLLGRKSEWYGIIPHICHERQEYIRVNFFWPV